MCGGAGECGAELLRVCSPGAERGRPGAGGRVLPRPAPPPAPLLLRGTGVCSPLAWVPRSARSTLDTASERTSELCGWGHPAVSARAALCCQQGSGSAAGTAARGGAGAPASPRGSSVSEGAGRGPGERPGDKERAGAGSRVRGGRGAGVAPAPGGLRGAERSQPVGPVRLQAGL